MIISFGRYNLLVKLGQGGMGSVFLARQINLRRYCAIKVINPQLAQDPSSADRFLREARSAAALTHPNLVSIFDCDRFDNQLFLAMEYVEGMSLGEILRAHGPLPLSLALHWLNQAAVALEYVHSKNIIHRDIKPDNMLVDNEGTLKIADLGLAKEHLEGETSMTMTGMVIGSPHYMSPEQINDSKTVDHRTDLYALGISFFHMLVGHVPFRQSSAAAICLAHMQEPIPSVNLPDPEITASLDGVVALLTAKQREERIGSATDLVASLKPWLESYPMDEAANEYFGKIDFTQRTVANLLQKEGVDPSDIDKNYTTTPAGGPLSVAPPPITPDLPAQSPPKKYLRWIAIGATALFILMLLAVWGKRGRQRVAEKNALAGKPPSHLVGTLPPPHEQPRHPVETAGPKPPAPAEPVPPPPSSKTLEQKPGGLFVKTNPTKAIVLFRTDSDTTPTTFKNVPPGQYTVKISLPGYREVQQPVKIEEEKFTELNVNLERISGMARIKSDPPGAEVIVGGRLLGHTPYQLEGGEGETMKCVFRHKGFEEASLEIVLKQEGGVQIVKLVPLPEQKPAPVLSQYEPTPPTRDFSDQSARQPMMAEEDRRGMSDQPSSFDGMRNRPEPGMEGPGRKFQDLRQNMEELFDHVLQAPKSQWSVIKKQILDDMGKKLEEKLEEKNLNDPKTIAQAKNDLGKILEEIKSRPVRDVESRRQDYVFRMMNAIRKAVGPVPGGTSRPKGFR